MPRFSVRVEFDSAIESIDLLRFTDKLAPPGATVMLSAARDVVFIRTTNPDVLSSVADAYKEVVLARMQRRIDELKKMLNAQGVDVDAILTALKKEAE